MKRIALLSIWFCSLNAWGALSPQLAEIVDLLEGAYNTMETLKEDLPFSFIEANFKRRALESRFTRANRTLFSSTDLIVDKPEQAIRGLNKAVEEFEAVGFLLPFHQMEEEAFRTCFKTYQQTLSQIRNAIVLISKP